MRRRPFGRCYHPRKPARDFLGWATRSLQDYSHTSFPRTSPGTILWTVASRSPLRDRTQASFPGYWTSSPSGGVNPTQPLSGRVKIVHSFSWKVRVWPLTTSTHWLVTSEVLGRGCKSTNPQRVRPMTISPIAKVVQFTFIFPAVAGEEGLVVVAGDIMFS